jgi:hypothetical protein
MDNLLLKKMQTPQATAIAYPVTGNSPQRMNPSATTADVSLSMDPNYFSLGLENNSFSSDIDLGGNFFSQVSVLQSNF